MRFSVHDLRGFSRDAARDRVISIFRENHDMAVIIVGHGDSTGAVACGVSAQIIPDNDDLEILWIYACNSARRIAADLAQRGMVTLGFATEVLVGTESLPIEIEIAQNCVTELTQVEPLDLFYRLRKGFYESAKERLRRKDILDAATVNHTRLSLRIFLPSQVASGTSSVEAT